ncbi:MAG: S8 family serine peptidase [Casimicrobium sp.]
MLNRYLVMALALLMGATSLTVSAQNKKRIERAADMPRFSYPVSGNLETLVRDDVAFAKLAAVVRRDIESVLAGYDIADKASERQLLGVLTQLDYLEGHYDEALKRTAQIRALQEKPADKLLFGMQMRAMVDARKSGQTAADAFRKVVAEKMAAELKAMPYAVISNDVKSSKGRAETTGETLVLGGVRDVLQPTVDKTGVLGSEQVPRLIGARYGLLVVLPLKKTLIDVYTTYLNANKVEKKDIWAARNVDLPAGRGYAPVPVAVWDSGVDSALFPKQMLLDASGKPALIAFDKFSNPTTGELFPIPAALQGKLPQMKSRSKGLSDLQSNIDSPEASEIKQYLSNLSANEYKSAIEEISLTGNYEHGTHVAGITMAGNPYARLAIARISFNEKLLPEPCPSREQSEKDARATLAYVDFLKKNHIRVVNMSWGGDVRGVESSLEECGIGKTRDERKAMARELFDMDKNSLTKAFASAPEILFVTASGNANQDSTFAEAIPAGIVLPNLITVGAVDLAGDEASFTSYGPTVAVHANGYQVESFIPGGERVALSGTSMASPQVANLAAKMLAVNPKLTPVKLIAIIRDTVDKTADGRRMLMNPAKAIAVAGQKEG